MSKGLNDLFNLAQALDLNQIKKDLFDMHGLTEEQRKEVEEKLKEEDFDRTNLDVKNVQKELSKLFK